MSAEFFGQGCLLRADDARFEEGLRAAVDYRGDCTLKMKDGRNIEGFIFSADKTSLDIFPKGETHKVNVKLEELSEILFSGEDAAAGKSWDEWVKKRDALKLKGEKSHA